MALYTHCVWGLRLTEFAGSDGYNSPAALGMFQSEFVAPSFWWYVPEAWMQSVHTLCAVVMVMFVLGFESRVTSILTFLITVSTSHRVYFANFGLDQINAILLFYLCIGSSGAALSVDRLIKRYAARRGQGSAGAGLVRSWLYVPPEPDAASGLALRLIQVHFCVIYSFAGLAKLQGDAWWNGQAIWMSFANAEYQTMDMTWIAHYPWIGEVITHTTILWEVAFWALIWVGPARPIMIVMGAIMHLGIGAFMGLWTFGLIMIFGNMSFWKDNEMERVINSVRSIGKVIAERVWWNRRASTVVANDQCTLPATELSDEGVSVLGAALNAPLLTLSQKRFRNRLRLMLAGSIAVLGLSSSWLAGGLPGTGPQASEHWSFASAPPVRRLAMPSLMPPEPEEISTFRETDEAAPASLEGLIAESTETAQPGSTVIEVTTLKPVVESSDESSVGESAEFESGGSAPPPPDSGM